MDGYTHIKADEAWIRLSDVIWEWFKPLNPWQINAVKTLVSVEALADERHPLRVDGSLELFIGIYPGGKPRLLMSLRQLEYIQYYIKAMKLIQPTPNAIQRYRDALDKLRQDEEETQSQALSEDQENDGTAAQQDGTIEKDPEKWHFDVTKLANVPLPLSRYYVLKDHLLDIVAIKLKTEQDLKGAIKNPRPYYQLVKGPLSAQIADSDSAAPSTRSATPAKYEDEIDSRKEPEDTKSEPIPQQPSEKGLTDNTEDPSSSLPLADDLKPEKPVEEATGPALLFQRAEQIYLAASQGSDYSPATFAKKHPNMPAPSGPASFLTIDLQVWEEEYGVVLDVGWSGCWFEKERLADSAEEGSWNEKRGGGHWIIKENEQRLNTCMKCSIEGKITRLPYVGTGDSEVLPWKQVLSKVEALIPMMQSRTNGGSLFVVVHSNDKDNGALRQLDLPIDGWKLDIGAAMSTASQDIFLIDTSEMVAAISNANNKRHDPESAVIARSSCSLEKLASHLLKDHPVLSCVTGNSGNTADAKMESFLVMAIRGLAACCFAFDEDSAELREDELGANDTPYDENTIEALLRQDDADRTILLHEHARRQRELRLRKGLDDDSSAYDSQEDGYDSEECDRKLLEECEMDYEISGAGPEDGIEDDY